MILRFSLTERCIEYHHRLVPRFTAAFDVNGVGAHFHLMCVRLEESLFVVFLEAMHIVHVRLLFVD